MMRGPSIRESLANEIEYKLHINSEKRKAVSAVTKVRGSEPVAVLVVNIILFQTITEIDDCRKVIASQTLSGKSTFSEIQTCKP
jgi:hypothetical protein